MRFALNFAYPIALRSRRDADAVDRTRCSFRLGVGSQILISWSARWWDDAMETPFCPHLAPFLFSIGYFVPPIPFLWLYKDTKCILKIINKWGEMRFVHRWVSLFCWVCNFWNGGGGVAKCVSCIMLIRLWGPGLKKNFFSGVSTMCLRLGSVTNQLDGVNKMVLIR